MSTQKRKRGREHGTGRKVLHRSILPDPVGQHLQVLGISNTQPGGRRHFTRGAKRQDTEAARNGVFNTVELLEGILLALPPIDIICCQRVARIWCDTIKSSVEIQDELFLRPHDDLCTQKRTTKIVSTTDYAEASQNGVSGHWIDGLHFPSSITVTSSVNPFTRGIQSTARPGHMYAAATVLQPGEALYTHRPPGRVVFYRHGVLTFSAEMQRLFTQLLYGKPSPTWEKMLFTYLPTSTIRIQLVLQSGTYCHTFMYSMYRNWNSPLTVGDLCKCVLTVEGQTYTTTVFNRSQMRHYDHHESQYPLAVTMERAMSDLATAGGEPVRVTAGSNIGFAGPLFIDPAHREAAEEGDTMASE